MEEIGFSPKEFNAELKTKECPSCAMEIDEKAEICPICQFEFPKRSPWITYLAIVLLIVWIISYIL